VPTLLHYHDVQTIQRYTLHRDGVGGVWGDCDIIGHKEMWRESGNVVTISK